MKAWEIAEIPTDHKGVGMASEQNGNSNGTATGTGSWEDKRWNDMLGYNPKFILRQWVLEELIAKLEKSGVEDIEQGRKDLAKILDVSIRPTIPETFLLAWWSGRLANKGGTMLMTIQMSTRPFVDWDEVGPEEKRLCGLGAKSMLGFQCSCSS